MRLCLQAGLPNQKSFTSPNRIAGSRISVAGQGRLESRTLLQGCDEAITSEPSEEQPGSPGPLEPAAGRETSGDARRPNRGGTAGVRVAALVPCSDDDKGRKFKKLLEKSNLSTHGILTDPSRMTTVKSRIISKSQHIARVDEETTNFIGPALENELFLAIQTTIETQPVDIVLFVDYDKGAITPDLFRKVNELALQKGIPTAVDPKKRIFDCYRQVTLFKPNFSEFVQGSGYPLKKGDLESLKTAAEEFKKKQDHKIIFITLSELGVFISNGRKEQYFPAQIRYIADVSGAGDTVLSVASLALAAGIEQKTMVMMSNIAGGLVCEKPGVVPVDKNQLMNEMRLQNF
ncbi:MAG: hypothetical protein EOM73_16500 [Bacteroidia bacterium]|nr:hypothetical protein [Bacteroidia bacterium]